MASAMMRRASIAPVTVQHILSACCRACKATRSTDHYTVNLVIVHEHMTENTNALRHDVGSVTAIAQPRGAGSGTAPDVITRNFSLLALSSSKASKYMPTKSLDIGPPNDRMATTAGVIRS